MSILIKGIKMPARCELCPFSGISGISCELVSCTFTGKHRLFNDGQYIDDCPLVEVSSADVAEVKHGEWIEKETFYDENADVISDWQSARCSVCNTYHTTPYSYYFTDYNFCPNCGARMDGGT